MYFRGINLAIFFKMAPKEKDQKQGSLFFALRDTLHTKHSLLY